MTGAGRSGGEQAVGGRTVGEDGRCAVGAGTGGWRQRVVDGGAGTGIGGRSGVIRSTVIVRGERLIRTFSLLKQWPVCLGST
uniref:Uncharacterized protein n=1 Tax=Oryza nivara TaxID=4536 RepID=A0A0E0IF41_ORYNI